MSDKIVRGATFTSLFFAESSRVILLRNMFLSQASVNFSTARENDATAESTLRWPGSVVKLPSRYIETVNLLTYLPMTRSRSPWREHYRATQTSALFDDPDDLRAVARRDLARTTLRN